MATTKNKTKRSTTDTARAQIKTLKDKLERAEEREHQLALSAKRERQRANRFEMELDALKASANKSAQNREKILPNDVENIELQRLVRSQEKSISRLLAELNRSPDPGPLTEDMPKARPVTRSSEMPSYSPNAVRRLSHTSESVMQKMQSVMNSRVLKLTGVVGSMLPDTLYKLSCEVKLLHREINYLVSRKNQE